MGVHFGFSVEGLIVFLLPMVINIFYVIFPPKQTEEAVSLKMPVLEAIEQGTRIAYAGAVCILVSNLKIDYTGAFLYISIIFLVLYHIVWIRYYIGSRDVRLLGTKFLGVPMPLAVFPVLYFIAASIWLHNYIATALMVIFGIVHNIISYRNFHIRE